MLATSKHMIIRENERQPNYTIEPGALVLPEDRVPVSWNTEYEQTPLGFAREFERKDNEIWATIDWIDEQYKAFFDSDGSFSKDFFELSAYATEVKFARNDDGLLIVSHGLIRAVNVLPLPYIPKGIISNAQTEVQEEVTRRPN
jgi:hypothetical protein